MGWGTNEVVDLVHEYKCVTIFQTVEYQDKSSLGEASHRLLFYGDNEESTNRAGLKKYKHMSYKNVTQSAASEASKSHRKNRNVGYRETV